MPAPRISPDRASAWLPEGEAGTATAAVADREPAGDQWRTWELSEPLGDAAVAQAAPAPPESKSAPAEWVTDAGAADPDSSAADDAVARAVRAYCVEVCGPTVGEEVASEVLAAHDPAAESGELLARATRTAAARRTSDREQRTGWRGVLAAEREDNCDVTPRRLAARVNGELSAAEQRELDRHLSTCSRCQETQLKVARAEAALQATLAEEPSAAAAGGITAAEAAAIVAAAGLNASAEAEAPALSVDAGAERWAPRFAPVAPVRTPTAEAATAPAPEAPATPTAEAATAPALPPEAVAPATPSAEAATAPAPPPEATTPPTPSPEAATAAWAPVPPAATAPPATAAPATAPPAKATVPVGAVKPARARRRRRGVGLAGAGLLAAGAIGVALVLLLSGGSTAPKPSTIATSAPPAHKVVVAHKTAPAVKHRAPGHKRVKRAAPKPSTPAAAASPAASVPSAPVASAPVTPAPVASSPTPVASTPPPSTPAPAKPAQPSFTQSGSGLPAQPAPTQTVGSKK